MSRLVSTSLGSFQRVIRPAKISAVSSGVSRSVLSATPGRFTISTTEPMTVGNWIRFASVSCAAVRGASVAPKSTVRLVIWLIPPPEPMDW